MGKESKKVAMTGEFPENGKSDVAEKRRALENALSQIERNFGKGSVMRLGAKETEVVPAIPTGSLTLDLATGVGGFPRGRIVEIYGPESSGKTTLALSTIAQAQADGGVAAFIDVEHALDVAYAGKLGVDVDNLIFSQPDTGEQALEIIETLVRSGAIDILVVDSVAALVPKAEIEGEMGDSLPGLHARLMSQAMRKLTATISKSNTTLIFINQLRMKIGVLYGNPETTTGGNALKFYASMRLDVRKTDSLKNGDSPYGNRVRVKIVKNKVAPPFRQAEFEIHFSGDTVGVNRSGEIIDLAVKLGVIEKSGAWYSYDGSRIGQGVDAVRKMLRENPDIQSEIEAKVVANLQPGAHRTVVDHKYGTIDAMVGVSEAEEQ